MAEQESFGQRVKVRRRELGLTQDELARRVGCAPVTLRKIEYDDLRPSVQIAERLAMALNIPLEARADFVRQARLERAPFVEPTPTPSPRPEEIGIEDLSGRAIRGYALGERIGKGGMGVVYRAVQSIVEREVAVKIILPQYANHPDFIRRFEAEAQLVARLEHPHIVPLYDYWREPNIAFLVMRLLRGGSLQKLLEEGPPALEMTLRIMEQIGSALGIAHRVGVIHRDLKPANILLDEDQNAYLSDFGIAKNLGNPNLEDLTQADAILGSPAYISPEQIRSEFVRPQSDIYCLGVVLYELLTGQTPFSGPTPIDIMHQHLSAPLPPLAARRSGLPGTLDAVIERATFKDPLERYPDVDSLLADLRKAIHGEMIAPKAITQMVELPPLTAADNPYKGLRAFGESDAADFFGREALIQQLLVRLGEGGDLSRLLAVVGPSGSGKSSVVRAGLVPALRRGGLPGSENWYVVELRPGPHPFEEIEAALLRIAVNPPATLLDQLREDKRGLLRAVRRCLPDDPAIELVMVIDQFEEMFTLVEDEATRAHLLDSLVTAALDERSRVRFVLTLRADFTDRPLQYVDLGELMRQRMEIVLPMTSDELERAIVGPADRIGLQVEPELAAAIIRDVEGQPGALPLLQYALTELFERRQGRLLTKTAYRAIGGVMGALGRRAEEVYAALDPSGQETARQLFLRLVTLGEGVEDTRRRVLRSELESLASPIPNSQSLMSNVIEAFGKSRLLSFDRDPTTRGPTVEVAHEALLREWKRLREWLDASRADVRLQRLLAAAAAEWRNASCDLSFLLQGSRLAQFEGWAAGTTLALIQDERAFLDASLAERQKREAEEAARQRRELEAAQKLAETEKRRAEEQARAASKLRQRAVYLTVALAVAAVLATAAAVFARQANENTRIATSRELAAAAVNNLQVDPERSVLLALQGLSQAYTLEAENALHKSLPALHLLGTWRGHTNMVQSVAVSPDGARVAGAGLDGTVIIWDAASGKELLKFSAHTEHTLWVTFSPDGKRIATASADKTAKVWDAATGKELLVLAGHAEAVNGVVFSPDGARLATASGDATAKIWDATLGKELLTLSGHEAAARAGSLHPGGVVDIVFSPDGKRLATGGADGTARLWDIASGQSLLVISGHTNEIFIAFSPDGKRLATAGYDGLVKVWDVSPGASVEQPLLLINHEQPARSLAFSPDGSRLAAASQDGAARVWHAASGKKLLVLVGHAGMIDDVTFSPDGARLVTSSEDKTVKMWDLSPGREWLTVDGGLPIFSPDGKRLATDLNGITLWDSVSGQALVTLPIHQDPFIANAAYSPDGTRLATASWDGTAKVWDTSSGQELFTLTGHTNRVWEVNFSPDGTRLVTASEDGTAKVWDAASGRELFTLSGHTEMLQGIAYSPDGKLIATASWDDTAKVWDATTGRELFTLDAGADLTDIAFSPDGTRVAASGNNATATVWAISTGKGQKLFTLIGHTALIPRIAFSPDGKYVATASFDGSAKVWDATSGQEWLTLSAGLDQLSDVAFSPDGTRLATGGFEGRVRVYALRLEDLVAQARSRVTRSLTTDECRKYLHVETCPPVS